MAPTKVMRTITTSTTVNTPPWCPTNIKSINKVSNHPTESPAAKISTHCTDTSSSNILMVLWEILTRISIKTSSMLLSTSLTKIMTKTQPNHLCLTQPTWVSTNSFTALPTFVLQWHLLQLSIATYIALCCMVKGGWKMEEKWRNVNSMIIA